MYGPDNRYAGFGQIVEKDLIIQEIAMDIMDMHHIRTDLLNFPDELSGGM